MKSAPCLVRSVVTSGNINSGNLKLVDNSRNTVDNNFIQSFGPLLGHFRSYLLCLQFFSVLLCLLHVSPIICSLFPYIYFLLNFGIPVFPQSITMISWSMFLHLFFGCVLSIAVYSQSQLVFFSFLYYCT